jgi:surface-anchored protein
MAAENLAHVLEDPLTVSLAAVEGPGHFFMWQANQFGSLEVRMNSRDGIGEDDSSAPHIGSHEHQNWGFSTNGIYRITFQLEGRLLGAPTNVVSLPQTVTFHVLPLPQSPFQRWQQETFGQTQGDAAPGADPDKDGQANLVEYAFGSNPKQPDDTAGARIRFVKENGLALVEYTPSSQASDVRFVLEESTSIPAQNWTPIHDADGSGEATTVELPADGAASFFRLRVELK